MKKIILKLILWIFIFFWIQVVNANQYLLFYWEWCPHCIKVEKYLA